VRESLQRPGDTIAKMATASVARGNGAASLWGERSRSAVCDQADNDQRPILLDREPARALEGALRGGRHAALNGH
jgi:hypothetical protein